MPSDSRYIDDSEPFVMVWPPGFLEEVAKFNPYHDELGRFTTGPGEATAVEGAISTLRDEAPHAEHAIGVADDGSVVIDQRGTQYEVSFDKDQLSRMQGLTLLHSHPTYRPPSNNDLFLAAFRDMKALYVVHREQVIVVEPEQPHWGGDPDAVSAWMQRAGHEATAATLQWAKTALPELKKESSLNDYDVAHYLNSIQDNGTADAEALNKHLAQELVKRLDASPLVRAYFRETSNAAHKALPVREDEQRGALVTLTEQNPWSPEEEQRRLFEAFKGQLESVAKYNPYHVPAGSPEGGQFTSADEGTPIGEVMNQSLDHHALRIKIRDEEMAKMEAKYFAQHREMVEQLHISPFFDFQGEGSMSVEDTKTYRREVERRVAEEINKLHANDAPATLPVNPEWAGGKAMPTGLAGQIYIVDEAHDKDGQEYTDVVKQSLVDLGKLPMDMQQKLAESGVKFYISGTLMETELDSNVDDVGMHPRGWSPGSTMREVGGCFDPAKNEVILAVGSAGGWSTALHEAGHAWDYNRGQTPGDTPEANRCSSDIRFNSLWMRAAAKEGEREISGYFKTQDQHNGVQRTAEAAREEWFAEMFAIYYKTEGKSTMGLPDGYNIEVRDMIARLTGRPKPARVPSEEKGPGVWNNQPTPVYDAYPGAIWPRGEINGKIVEPPIGHGPDVGRTVAKFNPYHDIIGRFTFAEEDAAGSGSTGGATPRLVANMRGFERAHAQDRRETINAFDSQGNLLVSASGTPTKVKSPKAAQMNCAVQIHNHPDFKNEKGEVVQIGGSFSPDDVKIGGILNAGEIRAVDTHWTYIMRPLPGKSWPSDARVNKAAREYREILHAEILPRIKSGEMTRRQANDDFGHLIWERAAPSLGLHYERRPHG